MIESERSGYKSPISFQQMEEKQWVRRVREEGDRTAFEMIYRAYYRRLHGYAFSYLKRLQEAEDVVQTVFLRIWVQRKCWNPPGTVKHYLFSAIRNEAFNVIRHEQIVDEAAEEISHIVKQHTSPSPNGDNPEVEELRKAIEEGINQLPRQCRQIFLLSRRNGLTYSEIAEDLDISVNTVGTQMGRALKSLRKHLSDYLLLLVAIGWPPIIYQAFLSVFSYLKI